MNTKKNPSTTTTNSTTTAPTTLMSISNSPSANHPRSPSPLTEPPAYIHSLRSETYLPRTDPHFHPSIESERQILQTPTQSQPNTTNNSPKPNPNQPEMISGNEDSDIIHVNHRSTGAGEQKKQDAERGIVYGEREMTEREVDEELEFLGFGAGDRERRGEEKRDVGMVGVVNVNAGGTNTSRPDNGTYKPLEQGNEEIRTPKRKRDWSSMGTTGDMELL